MAKGKKLESSQRGIAFSTVSALEVSILILIVGAGTFNKTETGTFTMGSLSGLIQTYIGEVGVFIFAIGFIAAALSSMLAVPLGAGLTVHSVFSECPEEKEAATTSQETRPLDAERGEQEGGPTTVGAAGDQAKKTKGDESREPLTGAGTEEMKVEDVEAGQGACKELPRWIYWGIISAMVIIAAVVISLNGKEE